MRNGIYNSPRPHDWENQPLSYTGTSLIRALYDPALNGHIAHLADEIGATIAENDTERGHVDLRVPTDCVDEARRKIGNRVQIVATLQEKRALA